MKMIPFPNKKYQCILADPPWKYKNENCGGSGLNIGKSGAKHKYSVMSIEDIKNLPISEIAMKDSCLFLWATTPLLPEAIEVMKAWKYQYKTSIYWRKIMSTGMGFWFRGQIEVCLFGIKGKIEAFHNSHLNFIQSRVSNHSEKPIELYEIINELNLNPKIELFARNQYQGWDIWGEEVNKIKDYQMRF